MYFKRLNTALTGHEANWTFIGVPMWKQDHEGIIYPPVWSYLNFDPDPSRPPNAYAHELAREDFAFLRPPLEDTDISIDYKCPYGAVIHGGIVFRAMDSARCYVLDVVDLGRKAQAYELTLWLQYATGYRQKLAGGLAPHSVVPDRIVQRGARTRAEWDHSSPDWVTLRVQASGTLIRVSMDGRIVFERRDPTYPVGNVGLVGRGAVYFRNLRVEGLPGELPEPWTEHEGELPRFFYPGGEQPEGVNAYPVLCHTGDGLTLSAWSHRPAPIDPAGPRLILLTHSEDEGQTWSPPRPLFEQPCYYCSPTSLFAHLDGTLTCLLTFAEHETAPPQSLVTRSADRGRTWSTAEAFTAGGRPLSDDPRSIHLYSPMARLADGMVVMCGYEVDASHGETNADRRDRSLFFRSTDDGYTWSTPTYFDEDNFDHNECMVAEVEPGHLVAFMRTLRAPYMWTSTSKDGGRTWARLVQSNISAECPCLLRHSSGALMMASRGCGTFMQLSFDGAQSWTEEFRISPASAMIGMTEMQDGRVLIIMHEGYRVPGYIRGQFLRVTPDGPVAAM